MLSFFFHFVAMVDSLRTLSYRVNHTPSNNIHSIHYNKFTTALSALTDNSISQEIKIRSCNNMDISRVANFLGQYWFDADIEMSRAQRAEFVRLENSDLTRRYGELVGLRKFNATLLVATDNEEILGYEFYFVQHEHSVTWHKLNFVFSSFLSYLCVCAGWIL